MRRSRKFAQSNLLSKCQNHKADCANFCGLLIKAELYHFLEKKVEIDAKSQICKSKISQINFELQGQ